MFWEIGRILSCGSEAERNALDPEFVRKWGSRCRTIYKHVPERFKDEVPDGIAAARELAKFKDKLVYAFERGLITRHSDRYHVDRTYERLCGKRVARRHAPKW